MAWNFQRTWTNNVKKRNKKICWLANFFYAENKHKTLFFFILWIGGGKNIWDVAETIIGTTTGTPIRAVAGTIGLGKPKQ